MQMSGLRDIRKLAFWKERMGEKGTDRSFKEKKLNKGQRGRKGKTEERSSEEYNLITSRESAGHGRRGREQLRVSRLDVTGNSRERFWMGFIPQTARDGI